MFCGSFYDAAIVHVVTGHGKVVKVVECVGTYGTCEPVQ